MAKSTIAELAQRKADLLEELGEVNAEIASRAGETDETDEPIGVGEFTSDSEPATVHTATDKTVQTAENTTATP